MRARGTAAVLGVALAALAGTEGCVASGGGYDPNEDLLRIRRRVRRRARGGSADEGRATAARADTPMAHYRCPRAKPGTREYQAWSQHITEPAVCPYCNAASGCLPLLLKVVGAGPARVAATPGGAEPVAPDGSPAPVGADARRGHGRK